MNPNTENISEGNALDMILNYCLEQAEKPITPYVLQKNLFSSLNIDEIKLLLKRIENAADKLADVRFGEHNTIILSNGITERFLKNGGFTGIEKENEIASQKRTKKEEIESQLAISNLRANELNEKIAIANDKNEKQNRIATWINVGIGIVNIVLLIWQLLK